MQRKRVPAAAKRTVLRQFERAGFELRRRAEHVPAGRATQAGALRHLQRQGFLPRTSLDIGAADGTPVIYQTFPVARHLLVEPLVEFEPALRVIERSLADATVVMAAVGRSTGTVTLNVHPDLVGSSVLKEHEDSDVNGTPRQVPQITLDTIVREHSAKGPFLLKVDTQGFELEVLAGGTERTLPETEVILLEVSLFQFFERGPQFRDVIEATSSYGFALYDIVEPLYRPLDGALAQLDVIFVREDSKYRAQHHYANAMQRAQQTARLRRRLPGGALSG